MLGKITFLLAAILCPQVAGDCPNADTSEGKVTLKDGESACAPLAPGQTREQDLGSSFVSCYSGQVYQTECYVAFGLRFSISKQYCDYEPDCNIPGVTTTTTTTTPPPTTTTTTPPPTTTTTTPPPTTTTTTPPPTTTTATPPPTTTPTIPTPPPTTTPMTATSPPTTSPTTTTPPPTTTTTAPTTTTTPSPPPPTTTTTTTTTTTSPPQFLTFCSKTNCKLPDCFCYGATPDLPVADMPQFIMLTFDDSVNSENFGYYKKLFIDQDPNSNIALPNGCQIKGTMYVSHENTDYSFVKQLVEKGNEIASHTIHHILPDNDYTGTLNEIDGLRDKFAQMTGYSKDYVLGFRSPYLKIVKNIQYQVLQDCNFTYDTSMTNRLTTLGKHPVWPFTLDSEPKDCSNGNCPTRAFPGFWEVPINSWLGTGVAPNYCSLIDGCNVGDGIFTATLSQHEEFFQTNFDIFYETKVPLQMFTHASMFKRNVNTFPGLESWLERLLGEHDDVWLVTPLQVIEWMKNPLTNQQMIDQGWGC